MDLQAAIQFLQEQLAANQFLSGGAVLMIIGGLAAYGRTLPGRIRRWCVHRLFMEMEIPMRDDAFVWFNDWLADQPYTKNWSRWLTVRTTRKGRHSDSDKPEIIFSPAPGVHWLWWKKRFVIVERERKEDTPDQKSVAAVAIPRETFNVSVLTRDRNVLAELLSEARDKAYPPGDDRISIFTPTSSYWDGEVKRRPRPLESIIMRERVLEDLIEDVQKFIGAEDWYINRGIPYRRGYLMYGPPGNGKSSIIVGVASHLKLDIYTINLGTSSLGDDDLLTLFSNVPEHSLVLLEDVDCVFQERTGTDDKENKLTFSGLLNAIDGVMASEGRMLFMTTNHVDRLDPALIRPGRCDVRLKIENADRNQAERLFLRFFPNEPQAAVRFGVLVGQGKVSMAALQGHLIKYSEDPIMAANNYMELLNEPEAADEVENGTEAALGVQAGRCDPEDA